MSEVRRTQTIQRYETDRLIAVFKKGETKKINRQQVEVPPTVEVYTREATSDKKEGAESLRNMILPRDGLIPVLQDLYQIAREEGLVAITTPDRPTVAPGYVLVDERIADSMVQHANRILDPNSSSKDQNGIVLAGLVNHAFGGKSASDPDSEEVVPGPPSSDPFALHLRKS